VSTFPDAFRAAMQAAGLDFTGPVVADGKLHRFRAGRDTARNSWFVLHAGPPAAGAFGCWKRSIKETWCERNGSLSQVEWDDVRRRWQEAQAERERTEATLQAKARRTAAFILERSVAPDGNAYLAKKGVKPHGELRQWRGALLVPLRDADGTLHSLQFIGADGSKRFLTGGRCAGCFFTVTDKADGPLVICEGVATGASIHEATGLATVAAMNCGNLPAVASALRAKWPTREIIIAADNDAWTPDNPGLSKATEAAKTIRAKLAVPHFADVSAKPTDFNDLHQLEGLDPVQNQIQAAETPKETDEERLQRLASLSPIDFDRCAKSEADAMHVNMGTLRSEVETRRPKPEATRADLTADLLPQREPEPWAHEVDGAALLDDLAAALNRFAVFAPHAADALALFILATYAADRFDAAPYVNLRSPEKRCGKSLVMRLLSKLCARALPAGPCSESAIFRAIAAVTPTLLIDEVDTFFADHDELRGMLNVGCIRDDAFVLRTEETIRNGAREFVPRRFSVFGPKVFAGIGKLADTLTDRCVVIVMRRKRADENRERFRRRKFDAEPLRQKCRRWADDHADKLSASEPDLPGELNDRAADLWEPMLAVADLAEEGWSERARAAAISLSGETEEIAPASLGTMLLADVRAVFTEVGEDRLASVSLCERLNGMEERPWHEIHHGKPLNPNQLARLLAPYSVASRKVRLGDSTRQGYYADDFSDAWARYVPIPRAVPPKWNNGTSPENKGDSRTSEVEQTEAVFHLETAEKPNNGAGCSVVPLSTLPPLAQAIKEHSEALIL